MASRGLFSPATEWAWAQNISNSGAKFVLVACAKEARAGWSCIVSQKDLAKLTGQGERTVRRNLDHLDSDLKLIKRTHRFDEEGNRTSDLITLAPAANLAGGDQRPNRPVVNLAGGSDQQELTTGQIGHRSDWPGSKNSPTESSKNNKHKGGVGGSSRKPKTNEHPSFAEWYAAYPKHVDPAAARRAFNAAVKKVDDPQVLIDAAKVYAAAKAKTDPRYIKNPATWLNADAWLNEELAPTGTDGIAGHGPHADVNGIDWSKGIRI